MKEVFGVAPGVPSLRLGVAMRLPVVGVEPGAEGPGEDALNSKLAGPALLPKDGTGPGEGAGDDALNSKLRPPVPPLLPKLGAGEVAGEDALKSKLGPLVATLFAKIVLPPCFCSAGAG